jgi:hypothetical protein
MMSSEVKANVFHPRARSCAAAVGVCRSAQAAAAAAAAVAADISIEQIGINLL